MQDRARDVLKSMDNFFKKDLKKDSEVDKQDVFKRAAYRPLSAKNRNFS